MLDVRSDKERDCLTFQLVVLFLFFCLFFFKKPVSRMLVSVVFPKTHHSNVSQNQLLMEKNVLTVVSLILAFASHAISVQSIAQISILNEN